MSVLVQVVFVMFITSVMESSSVYLRRQPLRGAFEDHRNHPLDLFDQAISFPDKSELVDPLYMKLSVRSWKNSTGNWVSKVDIQHSEDQKSWKETDKTWGVNVYQGSSSNLPDGKGLITIDAILTSPEPKPEIYDSEFKIYPDVGEYIVYYNLVTWHVAQSVCRQHGNHLVVVNSEKEAEAMRDIFKTSRVTANTFVHDIAHIGFNDLETEGKYMTLEGKTLEESGYAKWGPGNPNEPGHEDCGGIDSQGELHDVGCLHLYPFICELPRRN